MGKWGSNLLLTCVPVKVCLSVVLSQVWPLEKVNACKNTPIGGIIIPCSGVFKCSTDIRMESCQRRDCVHNHVVKSC